MSEVMPMLNLPLNIEIVLTQVSLRLVTEGLRVVPAFELDSACATLTDEICPHTGTKPCKCQLIVLIVHGATVHPVSLVFHGDDRETEVSLVVDLTQARDLDFEKRIQHALKKENNLFLDMAK